MRVYHLTKEEHALSNVRNRELKVARINDLNDPYELLGVVRRKLEERPAFRKLKRDIHEKSGLLCFSKCWGNPVLWSHYADKHAGICLGFDVPDEKLIEVKYRKTLLRIERDKKTGEPILSKEFKLELMRTKFDHWLYEEEYRVIVPLEKARPRAGLHFVPFGNDFSLREVIIGSKCKRDINEVRNIVSVFSLPVHVIKARVAYTKYKVVENRIITRAERPNNSLQARRP